MDDRSLLTLDDLLCESIASAEAAVKLRPELARRFQRILAMLWSARDEVDLMASQPSPPAESTELTLQS